MSRDDAHPGVVPMAFSRPAGFVDRHPRARRAALRRRLRALFERYGYEPVEVPTLEYIDLYHRQRIGDGLFHGLLSARLPDGAEFPAGTSPRPRSPRPAAPGGGGTRWSCDRSSRPRWPALSSPSWPSGSSPPRCPGGSTTRARSSATWGSGRSASGSSPRWAWSGSAAPAAREIWRSCSWRATAPRPSACPTGTSPWGTPATSRRSSRSWRSRWAHGRRSRSASTGRFACGGRPAVRRRSGPPTCPRGCRSCGAGPRPRSARWSFLSDPLSTRRISPCGTRCLPPTRPGCAALGGHHGVAPAAIDRLLSLADHFGAPDDTLPALRAFCATDAARAALDDLSATLADLETLRGAPVDVGPAASRGIAYYTGLSFELHTGGTANAYTDVCGGGRYDGLHTWMDARAPHP